jgi:TLD
MTALLLPKDMYLRLIQHGNGSCFLFRYEDENLTVYDATGDNDYFVISDPHTLAFGGGNAILLRFYFLSKGDGHFGLWINEDLCGGHSDPCKTFNNECLAEQMEFEIDVLQVWGFVM